jgi:hypothetical protein
MKKQIAVLITSLVVIAALAVDYECNCTVQYPCRDASHEPNPNCPDNAEAGAFIGEGTQQDHCVYSFGEPGKNGCKLKDNPEFGWPTGEWCEYEIVYIDCAGNTVATVEMSELTWPTVADGPCS